MTEANIFQKLGKSVIALEADAIAKLADRIDDQFSAACTLMQNCSGRIVVVGMGKSGHIGSKIAATLASTGSPAFFVHPGEASHGDLGMITDDDVVIAISNSGETAEILTILPIIKRMGIQLIAMTGSTQSSLAQQADAVLNVGVEQEACPLNLAPTSSTTATLAMGDALAVALFKSRGFTEEDFARSHPGGQLGRRLLLYVNDVMHKDDEIPKVHQGAPLRDALLEMTSKALGMVCVVDKKNKLLGIFTDGDLRRTLNESKDFYSLAVDEVMTKKPVTTRQDRLAAEVVQLMRHHKINGVCVTDQDNTLVGALNMHDLLKLGVV